MLTAGALGLLALTALGVTALAKDARDPAYAKARAEEKARSETARRLALKGVPADGNVLRNDPMYHAREIWDERCAGCHGLAGAGGEKAPDLKDYNSRAWIRGFLAEPGRRRSTWARRRSRRGCGRSRRRRRRWTRWSNTSTRRPARPTSTRRKAGRGRDLLSPKDCDTCHDFDGEGENDGPNLKGRGTAKWVAARHRRRRPPAAVHRPEQDAEVPRQADAGRDRPDARRS